MEYEKENDGFFVLCCFTPTGYRSNDPGHWGGGGRAEKTKQKHQNRSMGGGPRVDGNDPVGFLGFFFSLLCAAYGSSSSAGHTVRPPVVASRFF